MRINQKMVIHTNDEGQKFTKDLLPPIKNRQVLNIVFLNKWVCNSSPNEFTLRSEECTAIKAVDLTDQHMDDLAGGLYDNLVDHQCKTIAYTPWMRPMLQELYYGNWKFWSLN